MTNHYVSIQFHSSSPAHSFPAHPSPSQPIPAHPSPSQPIPAYPNLSQPHSVQTIPSASPSPSPSHSIPSQVEPDLKLSHHRRWLSDELQVMVATSAFGMGVHKPDVRLVVHWTMPDSPLSLYQERNLFRDSLEGIISRADLLSGPLEGIS